MPFLNKEELRQRITNLHEVVVSSPMIGGDVLIRELTAAQRMSANEAAQGEDGQSPDNYLYRAMLLQMMIVDPESGEPYADGRRHPETNEPLIDPRTRTPLFTSEDLIDLMEGREGPITELLNSGLRLSRLLPTDFRRRNTPTDPTEQHTGSGLEAIEADAGDDGTGQGEPVDERTEHGREVSGADGQELGLLAPALVE